VVEYLFQQGEISKGIFRKGSHLKIMDANGVQGMEADLLDHHSLHEAMEGVDAVYNFASPMPDVDTDFLKTNTEGVKNLLEAAVEAKAKTFVQLSTLDVYGFGVRTISPSVRPDPSNDYQQSKAEAERLLQEFSKRNRQPRIVVIRAAKAIGSRDESVVVPILRMIESGKVVVPSSGPMSFSHPKDIAQVMYRAATSSPASGSLYLVKSFDSTPEELAQGLVAELGVKAEVKKQGPLSSSALPRYAKQQLKAGLRIETQPNWKELGYEPLFNLKRSCEEIASWYRREPWATGTE
jgi:nucleoside-diphosphate-sugar epimerase